MPPPFEYVWPEPLDKNTCRLVDNVLTHIKEADDDFRLLIFGKTGTGKSRLALHLLERYMREQADIGLFGLNPQAYAAAVFKAKELRVKEKQELVACVYDEANILSTELMSEFPKEVIRMFAEIRGLNIFHMWCMPNPRRLPEDFTAEMFNGIIVITSKEKARPREFYYWTTRKINRLREKTGSEANPSKITYSNLLKWRKHADFKGCFRDYQGLLLPEYLRMKERKMSERVDSFYERFGKQQQAFGLTEASRRLKVSTMTTYNYFKEAVAAGRVVEDKDFFYSGAGEVRVYPDTIDKLKKNKKMEGL